VSLVLGCMLTHLFVAGNVVSDDDELVRLCEGEFSELAGAFKLGSGASMRVKHLRSYTEGTLKELVQEKKCAWELLPSWLDANNLRVLLRDYQSPSMVKKLKVAQSIPPLVFGENQGLVYLLFVAFVLISLERSARVCAGNYKMSAGEDSLESGGG
jgi:hypothetical protein